jgi:hypothetical protein
LTPQKNASQFSAALCYFLQGVKEMIFNIFTVVLALTISSVTLADSGGSYDYSVGKYPEITKILNRDEQEDCFSYVNVHQSNDGIISLGKDGGSEILMINYLTACKHGSDSGSTLIQVSNKSYSLAKAGVPTLYSLEYKGEKYNLHYPTTQSNNGNVIVSYAFACKEPASFVKVGGCSDRAAYEVDLTYTYKSKLFNLLATDIKQK